MRVGDIVFVRPGARVPANGIVVDGSADVDESMITGESKTVSNVAGARVVAGTVASGGSLRISITAIADQTALSGIMRLVATAQDSGSRTQALADRAPAYNLVAIPVAAGLFVRRGFDLPMSVGAIATSASTIVVAANAQLIHRLKLQRETSQLEDIGAAKRSDHHPSVNKNIGVSGSI